MTISPLKPGDSVRVRVASARINGRTNKWEGHFWHMVTIIYLSPCGRYARISGQIAWSNKVHETLIPVESLRLDKRKRLCKKI